MRSALALALVAACGSPHRSLPDAPEREDVDAPSAIDGGTSDDGGGGDDGGGTGDGGPDDGGVTDGATADSTMMPLPDAAPVGPITGGPCLSGAAGQTAYRVRWAGGSGASSTAYPVYEKNGLPDHSRDHVGAYGYQIGFTPRYEDVFLAQGGLVLDSSDFVDIELSTVGLASIQSITLSIYGRSFNTTTPGSFTWQTFEDVGAAPQNLVSNSAPYEWYSADATGMMSAGNGGVLVRIKAGPSSGVLVVNRIEICMQAN
ncbi:MAG: hypothetical protein AB7T06_11640 [Kofleriaceae bacterium]